MFTPAIREDSKLVYTHKFVEIEVSLLLMQKIILLFVKKILQISVTFQIWIFFSDVN